MFFSVLCLLAVVEAVPVLSEAPPAPPQSLHADNWLLTWTPATQEEDVTYRVEYSSFDSGVWTTVPSCVRTSLTSCNVSTKAEGEHGCVMLRVQTERHGLRSAPVNACSMHGDSCTPDFSLTAGPGSLTVHLSRNHSLALEHGDHAKHRVYYGKEGEPLQEYEDAVASVTIRELQGGQRYCAEVRYVYFDRAVGLARCTQCELIPESRKDSKQTEIIIAVVVILLLLIPVIAFFFIFQHGRIKQWLRPPYTIPDNFFLEPFPEHCNISPSIPSEEHWDIISAISQVELRENKPSYTRSCTTPPLCGLDD